MVTKNKCHKITDTQMPTALEEVLKMGLNIFNVMGDPNCNDVFKVLILFLVDVEHTTRQHPTVQMSKSLTALLPIRKLDSFEFKRAQHTCMNLTLSIFKRDPEIFIRKEVLLTPKSEIITKTTSG